MTVAECGWGEAQPRGPGTTTEAVPSSRVCRAWPSLQAVTTALDPRELPTHLTGWDLGLRVTVTSTQ